MPLYVTAWQDYLTVYRDMSGESLHRRGYRTMMHRASLNEAAAAGCLLLAGWPEAANSGKLHYQHCLQHAFRDARCCHVC